MENLPFRFIVDVTKWLCFAARGRSTSRKTQEKMSRAAAKSQSEGFAISIHKRGEPPFSNVDTFSSFLIQLREAGLIALFN
jgi:hypothetical protein